MRRRVLVVDDDEDIRMSLELALEEAGWEVTTAENGRDALQQAMDHPPPDAIVLDLMMPVMHGWELAELLRAHPGLGQVPVVVTSAGADDEQARGDVVLHKPYKLEALLTVLDRLTRPRAGAQPEAP